MAPSSLMSARIGSVASRPIRVRWTSPMGSSAVSDTSTMCPSIKDQLARRLLSIGCSVGCW
ncbi:hypothetical protein I551_2888 [Mycobacterium ulcerans str. Harvey]|uniref:Uncharacterized protein n=1 Tax=Mycobacterium ulcerans str. Harvey TaxID=1299332 RepID=A0ABN0R0T7_MYCUL|nr:hypothetical protein I551_2888 [Mycobacterium ulcerans str. Harvey]